MHMQKNEAYKGITNFFGEKLQSKKDGNNNCNHQKSLEEYL